MQPRKTAYHGLQMKAALYRDLHFRADGELLVKMSNFAVETGLSFSEMLRQAIHKFIDENGQTEGLPEMPDDDWLPTIAKVNNEDDPSDPLG